MQIDVLLINMESKNAEKQKPAAPELSLILTMRRMKLSLKSLLVVALITMVFVVLILMAVVQTVMSVTQQTENVLNNQHQ